MDCQRIQNLLDGRLRLFFECHFVIKASHGKQKRLEHTVKKKTLKPPGIFVTIVTAEVPRQTITAEDLLQCSEKVR